MSHHFKENFPMFSSIFSRWSWVTPVNPLFFATNPEDLAFFSFKKHTLCTPRQIPRLVRTHMFSRAKFDHKVTFTKLQDFQPPLSVTVKHLEVVCKKTGEWKWHLHFPVLLLFILAFLFVILWLNLFYSDSSPYRQGMMQTFIARRSRL